ncbi:MAG TPA: hypothetical protein VFZ10_16985 [Geminicoccaceae bacterium]
MAQQYAGAGIEPPLEELLGDEIARLVMRRDGLEPADVWRWIQEARSRPAETAASRAAEDRRGKDVLLGLQPAAGD